MATTNHSDTDVRICLLSSLNEFRDLPERSALARSELASAHQAISACQQNAVIPEERQCFGPICYPLLDGT